MTWKWKPAANAVGLADCPYCGDLCEVRADKHGRCYTFHRSSRGGCNFDCRWPKGVAVETLPGFKPLPAASPEATVPDSSSSPSKENPSKKIPSQENSNALEEKDSGASFLGISW